MTNQDPETLAAEEVDHRRDPSVSRQTVPQPETDDSPTTWLDVVRDRLGTILLFVLLLVGIAIFVGWEPEIPRFWYVFGLAFVFLLPAGWLVASYAISFLPKPEPDWVVDLDARHIDGALHRFPAGELKHLDVTEGEMCQLAPHLYTATGVDLESREAAGTWRGTLPDRELLIALEAVFECRGELEDQARRGFAIEKRFFSILRNTTRDEVLSVVRTFEEGTLPDGADNLHDHIDRALEDHGLEDQIKTSADDFDLSDGLRKSESNDSKLQADPATNGGAANE